LLAGEVIPVAKQLFSSTEKRRRSSSYIALAAQVIGKSLDRQPEILRATVNPIQLHADHFGFSLES